MTGVFLGTKCKHKKIVYSFTFLAVKNRFCFFVLLNLSCMFVIVFLGMAELILIKFDELVVCFKGVLLKWIDKKMSVIKPLNNAIF